MLRWLTPAFASSRSQQLGTYLCPGSTFPTGDLSLSFRDSGLVFRSERLVVFGRFHEGPQHRVVRDVTAGVSQILEEASRGVDLTLGESVD